MSRLLLVLFSLVCVQLQAQTTSAPLSNASEAYWNVPLTADQRAQTVLMKSQTAIANPASASPTVILNQAGIDNRAMAQTLGGLQTRLEVNQYGNGNVADATLSGVNNSLILNQTGNGNTANLNVGGTNNRFLINQDGGDRVNMQGLQKDNTRLELSQGRGNNSFTLDNSTLFADPYGKGVPNLRIEQSGGANITIQQGRAIGN